jgi:methionyl-tRNA formyltransferase
MNDKSTARVLFLGKSKDDHCKKALDHLIHNFHNVKFYLGGWGDPFPEDITLWEGDYIISYLSRWIIPESVLIKSKKSSINFHPATPAYPGIGCNNFALYENTAVFGVTCHYMLQQVDTGDIIAVKRFPVFPSDNVSTLLSRTYDFQLVLFYEIVGKIISGEEFNELRIIKENMDNDEIRRRVRATNYLQFKPTVTIAGFDWELKQNR